MSRIFKNQTYVRILLDTGIELDSTVDITHIYYKTPSGDIGYVDAAISGTQQLEYEIEEASDETFFDEVGKWRFWTWVQFTDGRTARGETVIETIYDETDAC